MKNPPSAYLEKLRNVLDHGGGRKVQYVSTWTLFLYLQQVRVKSGCGSSSAVTVNSEMQPERKSTVATHFFKDDKSVSHCWT